LIALATAAPAVEAQTADPDMSGALVVPAPPTANVPITVRHNGVDTPSMTFARGIAPDGREMRAGGLLVTFKPGTVRGARDTAHSAAGMLRADRMGTGLTYRVDVDPAGVPAALAAYRARADVADVSPDYVVGPAFTPNDPSFGPSQWNMTRISAPTAWNTTTSSASVKIAILDTGIQGSHADLAGKIVGEANLSAGATTNDVYGHGTHVAGIAAAATNNGVGVAGVGFSASILNVKVLGDDGYGTTSTITNGIYWAAGSGAKVINLSLGSAAACSSFEQAAVNQALSSGAVVVAAAGNDGAAGVWAPGSCAGVVSVGATDSADARATFSNHGTGVDIVAPGQSIYSTFKNGGYNTLSGTSMSTPHVSGAAALVWATAHGSSNTAVVTRLLQRADQIAGTGSLWANGRLNAAAAVAPDSNPPGTPPSPRSQSGGGSTGTVNSRGAVQPGTFAPASAPLPQRRG
jgi:thermitase